MTEKEFKDKYLGKVEEILRFVLENPYSDFYRKKYKGLGITPENIRTYADFQKIPLLTKDEILEVPLDERIFVSEDEICRFAASSGTTKHNQVLVTPHSGPPPEGYSILQNDLFDKLKVKRIMTLLIPSSSLMAKMLSIRNRKVSIFTGDVTRLSLTAKVAAEIKPQAFYSTSTIFFNFTEELLKTEFDFKTVRLISLGGEFTTRIKYDYFKGHYPNAKFMFRYGNSEIGQRISLRCEKLEGKSPSLFHPTKDNLIEFPELEDNVAELVYTHLSNQPFPLIRYKTGDIVRIVSNECECGQGLIFDLGGRKNFDILKVGRGLLHTTAISESLRPFLDFIKPNFQMHVFEEIKDEKPIIQLELWLVKYKPDQININLAEEISKRLFLAPDKTLDFYVQQRLFLPIKIKFVSELSREAKSKNIISHLE